MNHAIPVALLTLLLTPTAFVGAEPDTLESIEAHLSEQWSRLSGFSATMTMDVDIRQTGIRVRSQMSGPLLVQRVENGGTRYRSRLTGRTQAGPFGVLRADADVLTVSDGEVTYSEQRIRGDVKVTRSQRPDPSAPGGGDRLSAMRERYILRPLPRERVGNAEVFVVEARLRNPKKEPIQRIRFYFDVATGIQLRIAMLDDRGRVVTQVDFVDIRLNPRIEPGAFVYHPPEGIPITEKETDRP